MAGSKILNEAFSPAKKFIQTLNPTFTIVTHHVIIRINKQWRICFNWIGNNAYNVEIIDYH